MLSFTAILPAVRRSNTHESVYTRVLAALRHFDWATGAEVIEAINADTRDAVTARTALAYFVRAGLLLVRGPHNEKQWRINESAFPRKHGGSPRHVEQPGECTHCTRMAAPGRKMCSRCLERARVHYHANKPPPRAKPMRAKDAWAKQRRDQNRAAGLCILENKAGTHGKATHGVRCAACAKTHKESRGERGVRSGGNQGD